jgi:hypothetical protein
MSAPTLTRGSRSADGVADHPRLGEHVKGDPGYRHPLPGPDGADLLDHIVVERQGLDRRAGSRDDPAGRAVADEVAFDQQVGLRGLDRERISLDIAEAVADDLAVGTHVRENVWDETDAASAALRMVIGEADNVVVEQLEVGDARRFRR